MTKASRMVVVGASAGGIEALTIILGGLQPSFRLPIVVVIHLPKSKDTQVLALLQSKSNLTMVEVEDKQELDGGTVYLAPPDYHVLVEDECSLALNCDEPVNYSRPSIDVLFESAADVFAENVIGIILTGANKDGATGLASITKAGGVGIVQQPSEAHSRIMPDAAISACPSVIILGLQQISKYLNERT